MIITQARLRGRKELVDITISDGVIEGIAPSQGPEYPKDLNRNQDRFDAGGRLVIPPFVEAHIHLDYANTAGTPRNNESGTLFEAIDIWRERKSLGLNSSEQIYSNALAAAKNLARYGVGFVRTHVDITDPELTAFEALKQLKGDISEWMEVQIVAFPQNGIYAYPRGDELLKRAVREGADVVGAIPHLEPTMSLGEQSLRYAFDLAESSGIGIDVHCDEIDDPQSRFVDSVTALAATHDMGTQTVVSHAVAMGYYSPGYLARLIPKMKAAEVNFAICPNENLHLQGRGISPAPRGVAPIKELVDAGLNIAFCQDSMKDPWYPMGAGDLIRILDSGLHVGHLLADPYLSKALDFITTNPAKNLGITTQIKTGNAANLIVLDAHNDYEAVRTKADVLLSIHKGKTVFELEPAEVKWRV